MNCPVCRIALVQKDVNGITLDVCESGCGGIWFDKFEFKKFDENHEPAPDIIGNRVYNVKAHGPLNCPKCHNIVMIKRFSSVKRKIQMDECGKCAGIWLDAGELTHIRNEFKTEEQRVKAAEDLFGEMFGPALAAKKMESQADAERAQKFARVLRWACPSYYIPGKQKGGAF